ncbi:MAG TPA: S8 family serine peptidase, partial [Candidatus Cloacimonas sp.]|nr:S8 family serine peptidase [Candidatus Cloacimonas sp.]
MKIFNNNFRNILLPLFFFFFAATLSAQQSEQIPGVLHIKFSKQTLPATKNSILLQDISDLETYSILERNGFKEARKIFSNAQPQDTLGISRNGTEVRLKDLSRWYRIEVDSKTDVLKLIDTLQNTPGVESVSPAFAFYPSDTYPNDTYFKSPYYYQWGLYNYYTPGKDIHAVQAWDINKGRNDVKIAVVDGGVDYNHPDLDTGNRSRIIASYDFGDDDNDPMDDIPEGPNKWGNHGTPVAGVIGAITNNDSGVAGIMWNCSIIPVKVANNTGWGPFGWGAGSAFDWDIADGIDYARSNGASVINMSFGGEGQGFWENLIIGNPIGEATYNAYLQGVVLVAAMGNNDNNTTMYPAGYPWVIAVGATNQNDRRVTGVGWGSNYGSHINVAAPGISEYSTRRSQNYSYFGGTSCATPMVSGVAGLIISQARDRGISFTNDDVKHLLEVTADDQGAPGWDQEYGYGRINAGKALELLNLPYTVTTQTVYNSSGQLVWDSHQHQFYNNGGLATGNYYGVKQYKVAGHVTFPTPYTSVPYVWIRERECKGWSYANPNKELTWVNISNITTTGFDYETVIYLIKYNLLGQEINKYWPENSSSLQAKITYTVVGSIQVSINLAIAQFLEGGSGGTYKVNGVNVGTSYSGNAYYGQKIEAIPPSSDYAFYQWSDANFDNPRTITGPINIYAKYKALHKSNTIAAWDNTSQRKLIQTLAGGSTWLHQVYTSAGHVWIEHSGNGGSTWTLGNNGQPLDGTAGGKCPSIAYTTHNQGYAIDNYIGVVWQEKDGTHYKI